MVEVGNTVAYSSAVSYLAPVKFLQVFFLLRLLYHVALELLKSFLHFLPPGSHVGGYCHQCFSVDTKRLEDLLANILEAHLGYASRALSWCQLSIEVLWYAGVLHAGDMIRSAQVPLLQETGVRRNSTSLTCSIVALNISPWYAQDASQAVLVEDNEQCLLMKEQMDTPV